MVRHEVRRFLTGSGVIETVELYCSSTGGEQQDSSYLQLSVELPGGIQTYLWITKSDFHPSDIDSAVFTRQKFRFIIEPNTEAESAIPVVITGVYDELALKILPSYASREEAVAI
jgi:hypothetical protein